MVKERWLSLRQDTVSTSLTDQHNGILQLWSITCAKICSNARSLRNKSKRKSIGGNDDVEVLQRWVRSLKKALDYAISWTNSRQSDSKETKEALKCTVKVCERVFVFPF